MAGNGYGSQKDNYSLCGRVPRCAYPFTVHSPARSHPTRIVLADHYHRSSLPFRSAPFSHRQIQLEGVRAVVDYLAERREKVREPRVGEWPRWGSVPMTNPPPQLALACTSRASAGGIAEDVA